MPICASCGQPLDAVPVKPGCPSCTWRAALRASQAAVADGGAQIAAETSTEQPDEDEELLGVPVAVDADYPEELMRRLFAFADAAGQELGDRAVRVYRALLRGNARPYRTEVNRLIDCYIERLEGGWHA